jgi:hypothetical protein
MPAPSQGLLDSPGLQGALSAYFGAISSPRQQGLGGAIGHGGLAGLQAYEQAKTAQYQPYLIGAQIADAHAKTLQAQSTAELNTERAKNLRGIALGNHQIAEGLRQQAADNQKTNPGLAQVQLRLAGSIDWNTSKPWDPSMMMLRPYDALKDVQEANKAEQEATEAEVRATKVLPAEAGKDTSEADRNAAEAALARKRTDVDVPAEANLKNAEAALDNAKKATEPYQRAHYRAQAADFYGKLYDGQRNLWQRGFPNVNERNAFINKNMNAALGEDEGTTETPTTTTPSVPPAAGQPPAAAAAAAPSVPQLPKGAKGFKILNGVHGYVDASGKFVSLEPPS